MWVAIPRVAGPYSAALMNVSSTSNWEQITRVALSHVHCLGPIVWECNHTSIFRLHDQHGMVGTTSPGVDHYVSSAEASSDGSEVSVRQQLSVSVVFCRPAARAWLGSCSSTHGWMQGPKDVLPELWDWPLGTLQASLPLTHHPLLPAHLPGISNYSRVSFGIW